jgi:hypothetical protein
MQLSRGREPAAKRIVHGRWVPFASVNGTGYKLLGFVVWRGARWYARKRLPSARKLALLAVGGLSAAVAAGAIAKRATG